MLGRQPQVVAVLLSTVALIASDGSLEVEILSQPGIFRARQGSTVTLPCNCTGLRDLVLVWKQGRRIIFAGNIKVRRDDRFTKVGTFLRIKEVAPKDNGEYTCEVETKDRNNPKSLVHRLVVLQKPRISTSANQHNLTVIKGSSVVLRCSATGNPRPSIIWTKRNRDLAGLDHRLRAEDTELHLQNVSMTHGGRYSCTADNGVGNPVSEEIQLAVLYPPSAVAEQSIVLAGEGCAVDLVCNVDGYPPPLVQWYSGTMKLVPTNNIIIVSTGMRNRLSLLRFEFNESGEESKFTCIASSSLGSSMTNFTIIGIPGVPVFNSNITELDPSKHLLIWTTPSYSKILEHRLTYKQVKDENSHSLLTYGENRLKIPNMLREVPHCTGRLGGAYIQRFEVCLDKLEPGTRYQVVVQARNSHGWGEESTPVTFKTSQFTDQPPQESQILPLSEANQINISFNQLKLLSVLLLLRNM